MTKKVPFWLSAQKVGVVLIFENHDGVLIGLCSGQGPPNYQEAVKEFIEQMDDNWCVAFLEALHDEIERKVVQHWTKFAPQRLEEEPYKDWANKWPMTF